MATNNLTRLFKVSGLHSLAVLSLAILSGCGGMPTPQTQAAPFHGFRPAQPLTCTGTATTTGQMCDESDGAGYARHDGWTIAMQPDGHGTFELISETGTGKDPKLYQLRFDFPQTVTIKEVHGTLSITSWCEGDGVVTTWDALYGPVPSSLVGGKTFKFHSGDTMDVVIPQVVFPNGIQAVALQQNIFADLCGISTVHWVFDGSF